MADYVVDSNFFIQAHRFHYPMDVVPGFWSKVSELAHKGCITSIDKVKNEIYDSEDKLKQWCQSNLSVDFFQSTDDIPDSYGAVIQWAFSHSNHYKPSALNEFMDEKVADAWLVAFAYAYDKVVDTQEVSEPGSKKKVKIPDACLPFNIRYLDMITLLRELREQF
jgi:hypothetical protein